jgi:cell division protein FtsI (penicillin-binding protein 3)
VRRLRLLALGIGVVLVALVARLGVVEVLDGPSYAAYASSEVDRVVDLPALRGAIYDRSGRLIAVSLPRAAVVADDFLIPDPGAVAHELAPLLHEPSGRLDTLLSQRNGYVVLDQYATPAVEARVGALALNGITFLPDEVRTDLDPTLFQPVLGGTYAAGGGDAGIEYLDNSVLAGRSGSEVLPESAAGQPLPAPAADVRRPHDGSSVVLTLDEPLQAVATADVTAEMRATGAHSGIAVVEDVHTGALLADVDLVRTAKGAIVPAPSNLAVTAVYQPGSVMKIATFSFALQDHLITPNTVFTVPFELDIGGYWFQDAEFHPTMPMPASQILAQSSNIGTIEISRLLGPQRLYDALRAYGFGSVTGLGWPGESPGIIGTPATWYGSSLGSIPIGTGEAVTALQVLDAFNTVANGGEFVTPHLVAGTVSPSGVEHLAVHPAEHRVVEQSTARTITPMLEGVVQDGTAVCARVPGYVVAGKTGTAQVPDPTGLGYVPGDWNGTFVGFVPAQAPQLSGIVVLNHPQPIYGGSVSAPVFAKIMSWALRHYGIPVPPGVDNQSQPAPSICSGA